MTIKKIIYPGLFILNLGIILYFWWQGSSAMLFSHTLSGVFISIGRITGLLAVYLVLVQLVLIGRVRFLESEYGLDVLSKLHHKNGVYLIFFILAHPIFIILGYSFGFVSPLAQFIAFLKQSSDLVLATVSVFLFLFVVVYSILMVKKRWNYEFWYFTHLSTYAAILFAFGHQTDLGGDFLHSSLFTNYWLLLYVLAIGGLILFRFIFPVVGYCKHKCTLTKIVRENDSVVSLYISGRNMENFKMEAGQFLILRFLTKGLWWQAHPFSVSEFTDDKQIRVTIKSLGNFTHEIQQLKLGTKVFLDGPYGVFTASRAKQKNILLIAGGIGITPIRPVLENLVKSGKNVVLFYGVKHEQDLVFKNNLDHLSKFYNFPIYYFVSDSPLWKGNRGRITKEQIVKLVPDAASREIYMCAPNRMLEFLESTFLDMGISRKNIHFEKFSLS